jgi:hypothetical protein
LPGFADKKSLARHRYQNRPQRWQRLAELRFAPALTADGPVQPGSVRQRTDSTEAGKHNCACRVRRLAGTVDIIRVHGRIIHQKCVAPRCAVAGPRWRAEGQIQPANQPAELRTLMKSFSCKKWLAAFAAGSAVVALLAACASTPAPTEQMAVSRSAIANAASAGAGEFAPIEMKSAQEKMERANRAMQKEDYDVARHLAEEAQADARLAEKMAQSAKAQKAAAALQEDNRVLREEINRKSK